MVWGKGELTAEDLKKAGLDPADLAEMKANGVKKADLDSLKTELSTSMTDLIKNQFVELEGKLKVQPVNNNNNDNNNNNNNNNTVDDMTEFTTDPTAYINKRVGQAVGFAAINTVKMRMDLALDRAKATLKGFKNSKLTEEIVNEWASYKPENMATIKDFDPDKLLKKIHDMVIGAHADEINHDTNKREGVYNMVASGGGDGGRNLNNDTTVVKAEDQLTDIEKKQAAKYGMTPEQWVTAGKEMEEEEVKVMAGGN